MDAKETRKYSKDNSVVSIMLLHVGILVSKKLQTTAVRTYNKEKESPKSRIYTIILSYEMNERDHEENKDNDKKKPESNMSCDQ